MSRGIALLGSCARASATPNIHPAYTRRTPGIHPVYTRHTPGTHPAHTRPPLAFLRPFPGHSQAVPGPGMCLPGLASECCGCGPAYIARGRTTRAARVRAGRMPGVCRVYAGCMPGVRRVYTGCTPGVCGVCATGKKMTDTLPGACATPREHVSAALVLAARAQQPSGDSGGPQRCMQTRHRIRNGRSLRVHGPLVLVWYWLVLVPKLI